MKNLLISAIFISLIGILAMPSLASAQTIIDGDLVTTSDSFDIYIVKTVGAKKFKRLILNPEIFNSYGHLKWENVKTVPQATQDEYTLSELVIEVNADGSVADPKVYKVTSAPNSDVGQRSWLNTTAVEFEALGYDWDSIYKANHTEASPDFYPTREPLTYQNILQEKQAQAASEPKQEEKIKEVVTSLSALFIISITPNQIINNIDNYITVGGTGFKADTKVLVGSQFAEVTFISNTALSIKINSGLAATSYSIKVSNTDDANSVLYGALTVLNPPTPSKTELTTQEITDKVSPSVVQIQNDVLGGIGSGFIIDSSGNILTNYHVIEGDSVVEVKLNDGQVVSGTVLGWNEVKDLAIVKLSNSNNFATLGNSDNITLGAKVVALGFPLTQFPGSLTVLDGSIANTSVVFGSVTYIQTTASIQPGSSGGPLINDQGDVVGINTLCEIAIFGVCQSGWGQAVKINEAKAILSDLKAGVKTSKPDTTAPVISNIQSENVTANSATITWATDEDATSKIEYGVSTNFGTEISNASLTIQHSITLTNLQSNTTYYLRISSTDETGNVALSTILTFTTESPAPVLFEFVPIVTVGSPGEQVGHVYISILESFDSCTFGVTDILTGGVEINQSTWWNSGKATIPGETVDYTGFSASQSYEYKFICEKSGFESNTKTGTFTMSPPNIYTTVTLNPAPNYPNLHGEFFFWHWGGSQLEGSLLSLKIQVTLNNPQLPNELIFYKSGVSNVWETLTNISDGDILEINSFPSNYQLVWSFSGNPDDLSLEIIEGSATKDSANVPFYF